MISSLLLILCIKNTQYTPDLLAENFTYDKITELTDILSNKNKTDLNIKFSKMSLSVFIKLILIPHINSTYLISSNDGYDISKFFNEFEEKAKDIHQSSEKVIFILISAYDYIAYIPLEVGAKRKEIIKETEKYLKNNQTVEGINYILDEIADIYTKEDGSLVNVIIISVSIGMSVCCLGIIIVICLLKKRGNLLRNRQNVRNADQNVENSLIKIKAISSNKKLNKNFLQDSCIICLGEFKYLDRPSIRQTISEVYRKATQERTGMNETLIASDQHDEISLLECTHYFHTACIEMWLVKHRSCPTCRFKVDAIEHHIFPEKLVQIQTVINGEENMRKFTYKYEGGSFDYSKSELDESVNLSVVR